MNLPTTLNTDYYCYYNRTLRLLFTFFVLSTTFTITTVHLFHCCPIPAKEQS